MERSCTNCTFLEGVASEINDVRQCWLYCFQYFGRQLKPCEKTFNALAENCDAYKQSISGLDPNWEAPATYEELIKEAK